MEQLAIRFKKIQEYALQTEGGYFLSNFHVSNTQNGLKMFRLHFRRDGTVKPTTFDVAIHYAGEYIVDYKDRDQDTTRFHFPDYESVLSYLTTK